MGCNSSSPSSNDVGRRPPPADPGNTSVSNVRPPDPNDEVTLRVEKVDLNVFDNARDHHTDDYDVVQTGTLIVRRGQSFDIKVKFNRPYKPGSDDMMLLFKFGDEPTAARGSLVRFKLSREDDPKGWGGRVKSTEGNSAVLSIKPAASCPVGKWTFNIDVIKTSDSGSVESLRYAHKSTIIILFNAWCRDDGTYLHDDALCNEYVLGEDIILYRNNRGREPTGTDWAVGQFVDDVLECCLWLLDKFMSNSRFRGDPVQVSRMITQLCNHNDEGGIVAGRWDGDYAGGTAPSKWTGSAAIFEEFFNTKRTVKYGQCWVFSGVCTTFCRAIGIPCRSTTNFASAHDTNGDLILPSYYDSDWNKLQGYTHDSIWNFHVWNEAWMSRPDLPDGYGGWQAIDGTPQETSMGVYACGPVSLTALKNGQLYQPYDAPFVFAEFNGNEHIYMKNDRTGEFDLHVITDSIGINMSTKKANSRSREDVTHLYKHKEGSAEARAVWERATDHVTYDREALQNRDVKYTIVVDENTFIGQDLVFRVVIENTTGETRTVRCRYGVDSTFYTGVSHHDILHRDSPKLTLGPRSEETLEMVLTEEDYYKFLTDHCYVKFTVFGHVLENDATHFSMKQMAFQKPDLEVEGPSSAKVGETITIQVSFRNPLGRSLTGSELTVEGHGLSKPKTYKHSDVKPGEVYRHSVDVTPYKEGSRQLVLAFHSKEIYNIAGSQSVRVSK